MNKSHELLLNTAFLGLSRSSPEIPIITSTGTIQVKRDVVCLFSKFLNSVISSIPAFLDTAVIVPDIASDHMEHIVEILEHGVTNITVAERRTYFDIVEEAQEIGIVFDDVSIFKRKVNEVKEEVKTDIKFPSLLEDSLPQNSAGETLVENSKETSIEKGEMAEDGDNSKDTDLKGKIFDSQTVIENESKEEDDVGGQIALGKLDEVIDNITGLETGQNTFAILVEESNMKIVDKQILEHSTEILDKSMIKNDPEQLSNGDKSKCKFCEKTYNTKQGLKVHIDVKHNGIRYPCSQCAFQASRKEILKSHVMFQHEKMGFSCPICETKHQSLNHLKLHTAAKHESPKFSCVQCSFETTNKYTLASHTKNMHAISKELHRCDKCENEYASRNRLQQHVATKHDGIRYPCDDCHSMFSEPGSLKQHIKTIHENIRVPCHLCETTHSSKQHLKLHIENKHEGIKYPCSQCPFQAVSKHYVKEHIKKMHPQFIPTSKV